VRGAGWTSELFWTGEENLAPTGLRTANHPARSQCLRRR